MLHLRMFFPVSPGRILCSAFDHVFDGPNLQQRRVSPSPPEAGFLLKIRIVIFLPAGDSVVKIQIADDASAGVDSGFPSCGFEGFQPLLGIGLRQPQAAAVLVDLEAHFAAVYFCDPAGFRVFLCRAASLGKIILDFIASLL